MSVGDYEFDQFRLTPELYRLERRGRSVRLEKIPFDLLVFLVQHRDELVTREAITAALLGRWRLPGSRSEPKHGDPESASCLAG